VQTLNAQASLQLELMLVRTSYDNTSSASASHGLAHSVQILQWSARSLLRGCAAFDLEKAGLSPLEMEDSVTAPNLQNPRPCR
jgi:hypothetical protein